MNRQAEMESVDANKQLIRRYLGAVGGKEKPAAVVDQFVADTDKPLKEHIAYAEAAFPRYQMDIEDMVAEDDKVVVRFTLRATQQGDFMGIPPSGKEVVVPGIIIYRIASGMIAEHWLLMDNILMMQQLGAMPAPA